MPKHKCGDCGNETGEYHADSCDIERCPFCDGQAITCDCIARTSANGKQFINKFGISRQRIKVKKSTDEDFGD